MKSFPLPYSLLSIICCSLNHQLELPGSHYGRCTVLYWTGLSSSVKASPIYKQRFKKYSARVLLQVYSISHIVDDQIVSDSKTEASETHYLNNLLTFGVIFTSKWVAQLCCVSSQGCYPSEGPYNNIRLALMSNSRSMMVNANG